MADDELIERLSEAAHEAWMESKRAQGVLFRNSEWGEDLMVPYDYLTERAKDLDRGTVRGVLAAIERAGMVVAESGRLLPPGGEPEFQWGVRYTSFGIIQRVVCYADEFMARAYAGTDWGDMRTELVRRQVGPWVPVVSDSQEADHG